MFAIDKLFTTLTSNKVGTDEFGNSYYESRCRKDYLGNKSRYVIYKGSVESSKVPASWHAWLHYLTDEVIKDKEYSWQKPHLPNLTGTKFAYTPTKSGKRPTVSADYVAWFPWREK